VKFNDLIIHIIITSLLFGSAGCTIGPDYKRPVALETMPESYKELKGWKLAAQPDQAVISSNWWESYHDPVLNRLAEQVAGANLNVAVADAQLRQARALVQMAQSGSFPAITAGVSATRNHLNRTLGAVGADGKTVSAFQLPVDLSWELDLWGRLRRGIEASQASFEASAADLAAVTLSAQAALVSAYFQLRLLDAQQGLLDATTTVYQKSYDLTNYQYSAGVASKAELFQAEVQLKSTAAQALDLGAQRAQLEHAIALLIGKTPAAFTLPVASLTTVVPTIPPGLPSELLERRPDIAAAERNMSAANARIGFAQAAFYPTIKFSAGGGFSASTLAKWLEWPSRFWSIGPAASTTLYDGGLRQAQSDQASAGYETTVASYRGTVLRAFQEVEDNLAALRILAAETQLQDQAVEAARQSLAITNDQYQAGAVAYLNVLVAQSVTLANERTALTLLGRRLAASVLLVKALGGGWQGLP
jgi:NodT family efflux transporter outer membrane factor (OMF) lipoprotein